MNQFQEPGGRPAVVTRDYVLGMLSRIFGRFSPAHLISPWLDYLEAKGVVTRDGEAYELPGEAGALAAFPEDAQRSLHNAILSHARSAACPPLLKYAIPVPPSGGSGGSSQSGPRGIGARNSSLTTSRPDSTKAIERICWDREQHLKELAGFGAQAPDLFDWILKGLRETSSLARDRAEEQRAQPLAMRAATIGLPAAQPSPGSQPELEEDVPPSVDWAAERAHLVEDGDTEGATFLDNLLASPRRCEQPMDRVATGREGQPDRKVVVQPLTDEAILEALRNRRWLQGQRAELRKILDVDATTAAGICTRWRGLAALAHKFARHLGGREVIHFGMVDGKFGPVNAARMYPGAPGEAKAPELAWAEAFRESTSSLVTLVLDAKVEDVPVQRLLQGLDEVLDGKGVELGPNIREVDVLVRVIAGRVLASGVPSSPALRSAETPLNSKAVRFPVATVNMLVQDGKTWRIRFAGVEQSLPLRTGLIYLQKLLAEPGRAIHVADLLGQPVLVTSKDPIADPTAMRDLRRAYEDAKEQLTDAEENNDEGAMLAANTQIAALALAVQESSSPRGASQISSETDRVRAAVGRAIGRALAEIKYAHPEAHAHLTKYLTAPMGFNPSYNPPDAVTWQVNLAANKAAEGLNR